MLAEGNEYDRGVNTFSPDGRIHQIEYAMQAIKLGSSALGIRTKEGVVLAAERRLPSALMIPSSLEKIIQIDTHVGCVLAGLIADARTLVDFARVECQSHRFTYNEPMPILSIAETVADLAIDFGEYEKRKQRAMARPYGVSLLVAGIDENGPALFQTDPSGHFMEWSARAIGPATDGAQSLLKDNYSATMSLEEAEKLAMQVLKNVMEEKINKHNVELCVLRASDGKFYSYDAEYVDAIIKTLQ